VEFLLELANRMVTKYLNASLESFPGISSPVCIVSARGSSITLGHGAQYVVLVMNAVRGDDIAEASRYDCNGSFAYNINA
jgi:hypothetical protein